MLRGIVFDGDDTLWETEWLYDDARQRARAVVEAAGLDGTRWEVLERAIDITNVARFGYDPERFPTSCAEAYEQVCAEEDRIVNPAELEAVVGAARTVFERKAPLVERAKETLEDLASRGVRMALLTKGDRDVQLRRVEQSGLASLFDLIEIVDEKTPETISTVVARLGVSTSDAAFVGNSVRSDILPSLAAGVQPIWVDAHVWEYEQNHDELPAEGIIEIDRLSSLLDVITTDGRPNHKIKAA